MPYADIPGASVWFTDTGGANIPLVLMHAASGNASCWSQQIPAFSAAGYRCVAYDRRGWGQTKSAATGEQPGCASDDLQALADLLGLERFHLVGTAAGAAPSVDFALSHPERLRSLVIADCTGGVQDPDYLAMLERIRPPEFQSLPTVLREVGPSYRGLNPEGVRQWQEIERASHQPGAPRQAAWNHVTFALLEALRVPTLAIAGEADQSTPPAVMRQIASHIPNCQYATVLEAGHAAFWEQPDIWNRLVLDFVGQH